MYKVVCLTDDTIVTKMYAYYLSYCIQNFTNPVLEFLELFTAIATTFIPHRLPLDITYLVLF